MPMAWMAYLAKHNRLAEWSAAMAQLASRYGVRWTIENPADRGTKGSPAFWARMSDHGSLWRHKAIVELRDTVPSGMVTFAQCAVPEGADVQKYTTMMYAAAMHDGMHGLAVCVCRCARHAEVAHGRDAHGQGRAELAAAYPRGLSRWIAVAAAR